MAYHVSYILLGSNQGQRKQYLKKATKAIQLRCGSPVKASSSVYETAAWGNTKQASFLNQVIVIHTQLSPDELMQELLNIELELGRIRTEKYGPRTIDLDILFYDNLVYHSPKVTLPHPAIQDRRFVLIPLAELGERKLHPVYRKTIGTLLKECADLLPVKKLN
ncbi:2-amino-4-hydroxy-6-hydroxymethyldihydropteridine diphosphokinase [Lacibacter cauensis]|uniref:2-amino-4-hydroxy-6-hydroxymethyldihydropteridine pyrophosphokinase n=1 Tax=Lacibacter cauensis TaxID=510947 RepID=A0A562SHD7_9BACT|nr:2-amino-4-hydroxy-6-hydroxymethyldihydropteridine diphosphokinase [Lacibacter cauensis]TWI80226.1 2-amino-4-hydroxy-6-hydroxymethyldihydropteridine diphosphokinase [Lacibacter cauensis]